jgi:hypothetical protein
VIKVASIADKNPRIMKILKALEVINDYCIESGMRLNMSKTERA